MPKLATSSFERFYFEFLSYSGPHKKWKIKLTDGTTHEGLAWTSSMVNIADPAFMFHDGRRAYTIPFRLLEHAELAMQVQL